MNTKETTMKSVITSAIVAALIAGPAGAVAATQLNGRAIVKHSIPANRLVPSAVKAFTAQKVTAQAPRALAAAVNSTLDFEQTSSPVVAGDTVTATCPAGDVAIVGGYQWTNGSGQIASNWRLAAGNGWQVQIGSGTSSFNSNPAAISVYVACEPA
jgi:hypothetical protein